MSFSTSTTRRQRFAAVALSIPLALSLTGTAFATGVDQPADKAAEKATAQVVLQAEAKPEKAVKPEKVEAEKPASAEAAKAEKPVRAEAEKPEKAEAASSSADKHGTATSGPLTAPQPLSNADTNGTGANPGETCTHAYCSTRDGSASQNGKGDGAATGKPCAGCVGKADNKNPKGQAPNGTDHNAGYECDRNQGIGQSNPAHTGCTAPATSPTTPPKPKTCPDGSPMPAGGAKDCPKPPKNDNAGDKVTICHATGSATNPFVIITVSKAGALNGHAGSDHQDGRDIIPAFTYVEDGVTKTFPGQGDTTLIGRGCVAPSAVVPTVQLCPNGGVMPGNNPANCPTAPPVCPVIPVMGPVQAGCNTPINSQPPAQPVTGGGGSPITGQPPAQPAKNPVKIGPPTRVPDVVAQGTVTPLTGQASAPARARVAPSTLPFTGTDAALLLELGALLLLVGGGLLVVVRRERTARAAA